MNAVGSPPEAGGRGLDREALVALQERLGHRFADPELLVTAITHRSYAVEHPGEADLERLEYLGDAALSLAVAALLMDHHDSDQGWLSLARERAVRGARLVALGRQLGVDRCLRLGRGELLDGGQDKPRILEDATEAILGAVFLDGGYEAVESVVARLLGDLLEESLPAQALKDPKSRLQEAAQRQGSARPSYVVVSRTGPQHDPRHGVEVSIDGVPLARGVGRRRNQAEQEAARRALQALLTAEE